MKIGFVSLGCPKNLVDSEVMIGLVQQAGHDITADPSSADVLVVNTCAFIDSAKQESVDTILELAELKKTGRCRKLVVTGCLAERYRGELQAQIGEIDAVLGTGEVPDIVRAVTAPADARPGAGVPVRLFRKAPAVSGPAGDAAALPEYLYDADTPRTLVTPKHYAYVKVAEGCDYACAFCIIPTLRGHYRSRAPQSILTEARQLADQGRARTAADLPGHDLFRRRPGRARRPREAAARSEPRRRTRVDQAAVPLPHDDHRRHAGRDGGERESLQLRRSAAAARGAGRAEADETPRDRHDVPAAPGPDQDAGARTSPSERR